MGPGYVRQGREAGFTLAKVGTAEDEQDLTWGWEMQRQDQRGSGTQRCPGVARPGFWPEQISEGPEGFLQDPLPGWAQKGRTESEGRPPFREACGQRSLVQGRRMFSLTRRKQRIPHQKGAQVAPTLSSWELCYPGFSQGACRLRGAGGCLRTVPQLTDR